MNRLRTFYYANLMLIAVLITHQGYLHLSEADFADLHTEQVEAITADLAGQSDYKFAVVGNIKNSVQVFQDEMIPQLHNGDFAFLVSAGNAVSSGDEENYRAIYEVFEHLNMPYLLTFGEQEGSDFGDFRFYQYFGPHFFSFVAGNSHFVFLDGTGKTSLSWQMSWLERELNASTARHKLVFIGLPVHEPLADTPFFEETNYFADAQARQRLRELFTRQGVDVVFSANLTLFARQHIQGVDYVTTGGAGGLIVDSENSFHHYLKVSVSDDGVTVEPQRVDPAAEGWLKTLESIWSTIYSFFYVSFLRFLLIVSLLVVVAIKLHRLLMEDKDYYRDFDIDPAPFVNRSLKVGMFTNNYFPFVSGVSVSVERLRRGLQQLGDKVLTFVPHYPQSEKTASEDEPGVVRLPRLYTFGNRGNFPLANIFSPRAGRQLKTFSPDIIHVHHPFWIGSLGLWLGRRRRIPVVYTYHTRLEHYAHYVPLPGLIFRNLISHYLVKRFANKCNGVVVPTYSAEEYLRIIGVKTPILVQPTGIEFQRFQQLDNQRLAELKEHYQLQDEQVLISVSRLGSEKNIDFMLEALVRVKAKSLRPFKLLLIGDGPERERLKRKIRQLDLHNEVVLVGPVPPDEIAAYYQLGDIFVFASKSETQGMVILEAMSAGLPVVAVRSSGIDDVIKHQVNGYKTPCRRREWSTAVRELLENDALRARMSGEARSFAADYDVAEFAREIHEFYAYLLAEAAQD